jgi:hypothetical protein
MDKRTGYAIALVLAAELCTPAYAGRSCEVRPPSTRAVSQGLLLAQRTSQALDASGAQVVVLARAGQDLTKYGLRYSHMGFAYKPENGAWRVVHELNQCGTPSSALYRQGLGEFFLDDPWRFETAWIVPTPAIQAGLLPLLQDDARAAAMHEKRYNVVAYPWSRRYQQSNQWALETLAAAAEPGVVSRERAQAWLRVMGYEPTTLRLGPLTRLGARITAANIAFDDHPNEKRFSDRIETITVDSAFLWMERSGMAGAPVSLALSTDSSRGR